MNENVLKLFLKRHLSSSSIEKLQRLRYWLLEKKGTSSESQTALFEQLNKIISSSKFFVSENDLKTKIDDPKIKYISFDIDTLLFLPFYRTRDLFQYIEEMTGRVNFADERIKAEWNIRRHGDKKVSYEDIYEQISDEYKNLYKVELDYKRKMFTSTSSGFNLYKYALFKNKKVIIVTDSYHNRDFIKEILDKNGYDQILDIFVDSFSDVDKDWNDLFQCVINRLHCTKQEVLHFSTHNHMKNGESVSIDISVERVPSEFQKFVSAKSNLWLLLHYLENPNIFNSMMLGLSMKFFSISRDKVSNFSYTLGGILGLSYVTFIEEMSKKCGCDTLFFVARDGYILKQIYGRLYNRLPSFYVYASRWLYINCTLDFDDKNDRLIALLTEFGSKGGNIEVSESFTKNIEKMRSCKVELNTFAERNISNYVKFLKKNKIEGKKILVVDMTSLSFTAYRFMRQIYKNDCIGAIFSCIPGDKPKFNYFEFANEHLKSNQYSLITLSEFLISAPEMSVRDFDVEGNPVMPKDSGHIAQYKRVMLGIDHFVSDYSKLFDFSFLPKTFNKWLEFAESFYKYADQDSLEELNKVKFEEINKKGGISLREVISQWRKLNVPLNPLDQFDIKK